MNLTTLLHLVPRLRMSGAIPLMSLHEVMARTVEITIFIHKKIRFYIGSLRPYRKEYDQNAVSVHLCRSYSEA